ncbi:UNVERIFIED_CONTAM: hypothetical protein FKN15_059166 [Acipenser sinensis]
MTSSLTHSVKIQWVPKRILNFASCQGILGTFHSEICVLYGILQRSSFPDMLRRRKNRLFTVFSFTCVIDLIISLEQDGFISGFMDFYIKEGEPYLRTPYGRMICYWDGTVHYALYLMMVTRISKRQGYRSAGLYWLGSILLSMLVFLAGNIVGTQNKWGACWEVAVEQQKLPHQRPLDLLLLIFLLSAIAYTLFRGFAQFTHIGGSLHPWTPYTYRVPEETVWPFLLMNLLYAVGPQILALRCLMHPEFFLSPMALREADQDKKHK